MHVKLLTSRISVSENGVMLAQEDGAIVELTDAEAQRLIDSGQAEHADADAPADETANELHAGAAEKPKRGKGK